MNFLSMSTGRAGADHYVRLLAKINHASLPALSIGTVNKGEWLFRAGDRTDCLFAVLDGAVVLRKANISGDDLAVDLVTKGGTLGYRAYIGGGVHSLGAQCSVEGVVCRIPVEALSKAEDRSIEDALIRQLADELTATRDRMLQVATLNVQERLLILIARIARDFTVTTDHQAMVVCPPVSRIDMAALAGMTPESLSRCIRRIERDDLAHFSRRHVVIPSVAAFRAELSRIGVGAEAGKDLELSLAG